MKVHQVTHLFSPDELAGASLYTDLARFLADSGHDLRVTATFSYYPGLRYADEDRGVSWREEKRHDIRVRRVGMYLPKLHRSWRRLLPELSFTKQLVRFARFPDWTPDVVLTACPMLAQVTAQHFLYRGKNIPRLVIVQDSMAHAATELGIIKSKPLGKTLHAFERWSLKAATQISTISEGMRERVNHITRGSVPCVVTPNWVHQSLRELIEAKRSAVGPRLAGQLLYSGNFGVKQGLPGFLRDFRAERGDWTIAIHGAGPEAETLARETTGWGDWLRRGPLLPEPEYVEHLLRTTACVVTQMPGVGANFLPSKLLPALAAGTPVLAVCDPDTPLGREVSDGQFGHVVRPGDAAGLKRTLEEWRRSPARLQAYSRNAMERSKLYSRERSCGAYERLLQQLVADARG